MKLILSHPVEQKSQSWRPNSITKELETPVQVMIPHPWPQTTLEGSRCPLGSAYQVFDLMLSAGLESHGWQFIPKVIQPLLHNLLGDQVWRKQEQTELVRTWAQWLTPKRPLPVPKARSTSCQQIPPWPCHSLSSPNVRVRKDILF